MRRAIARLEGALEHAAAGIVPDPPAPPDPYGVALNALARRASSHRAR